MYDNIDGYMRVIEMLSYVMSTIRYYPYASVVYKMAYHKFFVNTTQSIAPATQSKQTPSEQATPAAQAAPTLQASPESNPDFVWDMDSINEKLIAAIDREGIKKNLQDHIILEYI